MPTGTASDFPYILPSLPGFNQELPVPEIMSRLPPEEVGRELAAQYFDVVGTTTRIVQPWTWEEKFFLHVYHTSSPNQQRLAVVFLVFAVGALMDINRAVPDKTADEYFASARMCLTMDSTHSVTYVQCLYLCGIYLMNGPGKLARGDIVWPLLRTALGVAEAIGLHRDATHWNLDDATVTERRYVFWSIHHFDVVQSIGLGRSQCIADHCIDCVIPPHEADSAFFPKTYELIRIVSRINDLQVRMQPATYEEACSIDQTLWSFEQALPIHLSAAALPNAADLIDSTLRQAPIQRNQLLLYLNEARLALHRPWFVRALRDCPEEPSNSQHKQSFVGYLEACRAIIGSVSNMVAIRGTLVQRRWHYFHHLFSACVGLSACSIRAPSSTLARSALSELDRGVSLFRLGSKDTFVSYRAFPANSHSQLLPNYETKRPTLFEGSRVSRGAILRSLIFWEPKLCCVAHFVSTPPPTSDFPHSHSIWQRVKAMISSRKAFRRPGTRQVGM
jgi:hypothetical protein